MKDGDTGDKAKKIVGTGNSGMNIDWSVSENRTLVFSESGNCLFFGSTNIPVEEPPKLFYLFAFYNLQL